MQFEESQKVKNCDVNASISELQEPGSFIPVMIEEINTCARVE